MTNQEYAKRLVRTNGLLKARSIAQRSLVASGPNVWLELPKGKVFLAGDDKKAVGITLKMTKKTHAFWMEVVGLLKKYE